MKYWMLEKGDVTGPFESSELQKIENFNLETLVCPENLGDNHTHWKPASFYFDFTGKEKTEIKSGLTTQSGRKLTDGDKISIEEYFSNVYQSEHSELSEILGIPDEPENSDMYLGRFLQRELRPSSKTKNTKMRRIELELEKEQRKYDKTFGAPGKILSRDAAQPEVKENTDFVETLKPVTARGPAYNPADKTEGPVPDTAEIARQEAITNLALGKAQPMKIMEDDKTKPSSSPYKQDSPNDIFVKDVPAAAPVSEPLKTVPSENTDSSLSLTVKRTQLKAQNIAPAADVKKPPQSRYALAAVAVGIIFVFLLSLVFIFNEYRRKTAPQFAAQADQFPEVPEPVMPSAAPDLLSLPDAVPPAAAAVPAAPAVLPPLPSSAQTAPDANAAHAITIAQNDFLKDKNATVDNFLSTYFEQYRSHGYTAAWTAEPLHNDSYIVKYRLSKPRQEPIVYIFEVDVKKGAVTGALNNLTLDLLGM